MKRIVAKPEKIALGAVYLLALAAYILSAVQGGIAHTGGGLPIPDSGMTVGLLLFAGMALMAGIVYAVYAKFSAPWLRVLGLVITGAKLISVALAELLIDRYVWSAAYLQSASWEWLQGSGWYTVFVSVFVACTAASAVLEILIWVRSKAEIEA